MTVMVDTGGLYALLDAGDRLHHPVLEFVQSTSELLVIPSTILPEISYLINKYLNVEVELKMLEDVKEGNLALEILKPVDLTRAIEVIATYRDARIGFVDASIVAMAERMKLKKILTTDVAHFTMFRPEGTGYFEIVPETILEQVK